MSAPQSGVYDESMVVVAEGPKSVGWHDHHGMELTHVREFEPRYARGARSDPSPPTSRCQPYELRNGTAEILSQTKPETCSARAIRDSRAALTFHPPHSEPSDSDDERRSPRGRGDAVAGCCVIQ